MVKHAPGFRTLFCAAAMAVALFVGGAQAQTTNVHVPEQALSQSLKDIAGQTGTNILFTPDAVDGLRAHALAGNMSAREAVAQLIAGSNLEVVADGNGGLIVRKKEAPKRASEARGSGTETVLVTGSRIPGAQASSPVITVTQNQMKVQGYHDLGSVIRNIPQSFNGGQNPGVLPNFQPNSADQNITSGSSINLRGLGPDATLTLLNGRRLPYDGFAQAVDLSVVPFEAVDRIEILLDGASAIYGSDAVAGVANIILKRDYDGLSLTGRFAGATDGGDMQTQYRGVGGKTWDTGGALLAFSSEQDTSIDAKQRDVSNFLPPHNTLLPSIVQESGLFSGHQDLAPGAELDLDAVYSHRDSHSSINAFGELATSATRSTTWAITPTLRVRLPMEWMLTASGSVAIDHSHVHSVASFGGFVVFASNVCYCNDAHSAEVNVEGPLFALPGGDAHASIGAGYRRQSFSTPGSQLFINGTHHSFFTYGEVNLPFVSSDQNIPFVDHLTLNGAERYESYSDVGSVTTPKIGLVWGPTSDVDIKGTWGKSFKAPTLQAEFSPSLVELEPLAGLGGVGAPDATGIVIQGGSPNLRAERATTYTFGADVHPQFIPGLDVQADYFSVDYTNRVLAPISILSSSLSDPAFADFITFNPPPALIASYVANAAFFFNQAGAPYNPAKVVVLVDDRARNVARQTTEGVDLSFDYATELFDGTFTTSGNATWLRGRQRNTRHSPEIVTVGMIFNPPRFRARGGVTWAENGLTLSSFVNYIGSVTNTLVFPPASGSGMTTVDIAIDYQADTLGPLDNVEFNLAVTNLLDEKPPTFKNFDPFVVNYDPLNYSAFGRVIGASITKRW